MKAAGARGARAALVVAALVASDGIIGGAAARTMQQKLEEACSASVARLCPGLKSSSDDVKTCLMRRRSEVDADCMRLVDASE